MLSISYIFLILVFVSQLCYFGWAEDENTVCTTSPGCSRSVYYGNRKTHYCQDIVDYPYFLPIGMSQKHLDAAVKVKLNSTSLYIMPTACQVYAKRMACGRAFLKYASPGDPNIYPTIPNPLPFHRPCMYMCTNASAICPLMFIDCTEKIKYLSAVPTPVNVYGLENTCNLVKPTNTPVVAPQAEVYSGSTCANIIPPASKVIIPPANSVNPSLVNFQPPGVVQALIDKKLGESFSSLPLWIKSDCHLALRKYFCGKYFPSESIASMSKAFQDYGVKNNDLKYSSETSYTNAFSSVMPALKLKSIYSFTMSLPSYPNKSICLEYKDTCADFIAIANMSSLVPNCAEKDSRGIDIWPTGSNLVLVTPAAPGPLAAIIPSLSYYTSPNTMALAVDKDANSHTYQTKCPSTFVVPDDPSDPLVKWVTGSGCAVPCKRNIWTHQEWISFDRTADAIPSIGIVCIVTLLIMWVFDRQRRKQYLVVCFTVTSMIATLFVNFMSNEKNLSKRGENSAVCVNNAVQITSEVGATLCASQSVVLLYCGLACCLSWLVQAFDLFQKLILDIKNTERFFWYHLSFIFGLPLIPTIILLSWGVYGYGGNLPWCFFSATAREEDDIVLFYIPILVITILGVIFMSCVIGKIIYTLWKSNTLNSKEASESKRFLVASKVLRIPILFVLLFLLCWVSLFSYRSLTYSKRHIMKESFMIWIECVFVNWDGITSSSWESVCGAHLKERVNVRLAFWITFCVTGQSILISVIFLINPRLTFPSDLLAFLKDYIPFLRPYLPDSQGLTSMSGKSFNTNTSDIEGPSTDNTRHAFFKRTVSRVYVDDSVSEIANDSTETANNTQTTTTVGAVANYAISEHDLDDDIETLHVDKSFTKR